MAEEIVQKLGFDVSDALKSLDVLDARLKEMNKSLDNFAKALGRFNRSASGAGVEQLGNAAATSGQKLSKAAAEYELFGKAAEGVGSQVAAGTAGVVDAAQKAATATQGLGTRTQAGAAQAGNAVQTFSQRAKAQLGSVIASARQAGAAVAQLGRRGAANLQQFTLGFQTLGRIVSTQIIIRGINAISQAFTSSIQSAKEFQLQISEIQTITDNAFGSFERAASAVREVSDAFNLPLGAVSEGLYQVISNQIQGAANQIAVLQASAVLAKVGVADFDDTVSLLTGTINAFQLQAGEASRIAGVFFKTVELGRTRIQELAQNFGTVAPLAQEAGISFEELAAAFATITINGVETSKAATQLRGVINAFIKPTKEMQKVLEEAGFASGETAIRVLGLGGALQLLQDATGGSVTQLAKLVPRVRGLAGTLVLAREEGEKLEQNLDEIIKTTAELVDQKLELRIVTDAERVERELNQIQNAFTVDVGQAILKTIRIALEWTNASGTIATAARTLVPIIGGLATIMAFYGGVAAIVAAKNFILASSFVAVAGSLALIPAAIIAGIAGGLALTEFFDSLSETSTNAAFESAREANEAQLRESRKGRNAILQEEIRNIKDRFNVVAQFVADERAKVSERVETWEKANKKIQEDTEQVFDSILSANKELVSNLGRERQSALEAATEAETNAADLRAGLADDQFKFENRRFNQVQQISKLEQRAQTLARQAAQQIAAARTDEQRASAQSIAQRAQAFSQEAQSVAEQVGNQSLITRSFQNRVNIANQLIRAEERQAGLQRQIAAEAEAAEAKERKRVDQLTKVIQTITKLQEEFKVTASPEDRGKIAKQLADQFTDFDRLAIPQGGFGDAGDLFSYEEFRKNLLEGIKSAEDQGINIRAVISGEALQSLNRDITQVFTEAFSKGLRAALQAGVALEDVQKLSLETPSLEALDRLSESILQTRDAEAQAAQNAEAIEQASEDLNSAAEEINAAFDKGIGIGEAIEKSILGSIGLLVATGEAIADVAGADTGLSPGEAFGQIGDFEQRITTLLQNAQNLPAETINARLEQLNKDLQNFQAQLGVGAKLTFGEELRVLDAAVQRANQALQQANQQGTLTSEQIQTALTGVKGIGESAKQSAEAAAAATERMAPALSSSAQSANTLSSDLQNGAIAAASIAQSLSNVPQGAITARTGRFFRNGGLTKYLAGGGFSPRGTDTIPAMLSPGEFVMNARSTKKWFSQLQAMNAGFDPVYRAEGGPVTNVGDINVSVSADSKNPGQTGRQIARSLRRELRRNTSSV